jgi:hypothetical protein
VNIPEHLLPPTEPNMHAAVSLLNKTIAEQLVQHSIDRNIHPENVRPTVKFLPSPQDERWTIVTRFCQMSFLTDAPRSDIDQKFLEPYLGFDGARLEEELIQTNTLEQTRKASYTMLHGYGRPPNTSGGRLANSVFVCAPTILNYESFPVYSTALNSNNDISVSHVLYRVLLDSTDTTEDMVDIKIKNRQWLPIANLSYESIDIYLKLVLMSSDTFYDSNIQSFFSGTTYAHISFRRVRQDENIDEEEDND